MAQGSFGAAIGGLSRGLSQGFQTGFSFGMSIQDRKRKDALAKQQKGLELSNAILKINNTTAPGPSRTQAYTDLIQFFPEGRDMLEGLAKKSGKDQERFLEELNALKRRAPDLTLDTANDLINKHGMEFGLIAMRELAGQMEQGQKTRELEARPIKQPITETPISQPRQSAAEVAVQQGETKLRVLEERRGTVAKDPQGDTTGMDTLIKRQTTENNRLRKVVQDEAEAKAAAEETRTRSRNLGVAAQPTRAGDFQQPPQPTQTEPQAGQRDAKGQRLFERVQREEGKLQQLQARGAGKDPLKEQNTNLDRARKDLTAHNASLSRQTEAELRSSGGVRFAEQKRRQRPADPSVLSLVGVTGRMNVGQAEDAGINMQLSNKAKDDLLSERSARSQVFRLTSRVDTILEKTPEAHGKSARVVQFLTGALATTRNMARSFGWSVTASNDPARYKDALTQIGIKGAKLQSSVVILAYLRAIPLTGGGKGTSDFDVSNIIKSLGSDLADPIFFREVMKQTMRDVDEAYRNNVQARVGHRPRSVIPEIQKAMAEGDADIRARLNQGALDNPEALSILQNTYKLSEADAISIIRDILREQRGASVSVGR